MAPRVRAVSLAPTGTKKKDIEKGSTSTTQKVVTRRIAALNVPSVKGKGKVLLEDSREKQGQAKEGMETEEEGENGVCFLHLNVEVPPHNNRWSLKSKFHPCQHFLPLQTYLPNRFLSYQPDQHLYFIMAK